MILLTEFYEPVNNPERFEELLYCFSKNLELDSITEIYFFANKYDTNKIMLIENIEEYRHKVRSVECVSRPTYFTFFNFASRNIKENENVIICNSDIHFDSSLSLLKDIDMTNKFYILNRYDNNILFDVPYSQDTWIFKNGLILKESKFNLGVPGCDNRIAYLAHINGNTIYNPSKLVKSHHIHKETSRNYQGKVLGPYLLSEPNENVNIASNVRIISRF